ncbi:MAG: AMP-binding protein, partial [Lautropia sp.]
MKTLWDALQAAAREAARQACIVVPPNPARGYWPQGIEWTYGEVCERVSGLAARYAGRGWGHGHRVAVLLENRPEFMLHMLALNALGAMVVPINPDYRRDDLAFLLQQAQPDLVVAIAARAAWLREIAAPIDPGLAVVEEPAFDAALPRARRAAAPGTPSIDTAAVLLYTSGTTGMPKGCLIGNDYFFFAAERYLGAGGLMRVEHGAARLYNPLPLFYANSLTISNPAMILSRNAMIFPD